MNAEVFREFIINNLPPWAESAAGGKEIVTRCKYCPDSKNPKKGHMYIKVPHDDELSTYYCQKCKETGLVTPSKLMEWGINDVSFITDLTMYNKRVSGLAKNKRFTQGSSIVYNINSTQVTRCDQTLIKLNYLNSRIGTHLKVKEAMQLKIVFNIFDLLNENHLQVTRNMNVMNQLNCFFMGFLSCDNAFVNLRNVANEEESKQLWEGINKRYVNYNLFNKFENTQRFYTIPSMVEFTSPINLHIAEGSFDILSIYMNLRNTPEERYNSIFTAVGGSAYKGIIKFFMINRMIPNMIVHIYADNDIERYKIQDIAYDIKPFGIPVYLHRNTFPGEKDFGVPLDRINEVIERLI